MNENAVAVIDAHLTKLEAQKKDAEASFLQFHGASEILKAIKAELLKPVEVKEPECPPT
jgi:hypothetical protein